MAVEVKPRVVAWETITTDFPPGTKFMDAIEKVGLNYKVEFRDLYVEDPEYGKRFSQSFRATVRTDTGQIIGVVGQRYNIVQNKDAFAFLTDIIDGGEVVPLGAGWWRDGAQPWIQARLPNDIKVDGDSYIPFIFAATSHDGSVPVTVALSAIRVVCRNTYAANLKAPRVIRVRHLGEIDRRLNLEEARRILGISFEYFEQFGQFMKTLQGQPLQDEQFKRLADALFPMPKGGDEERNRARENAARRRAELLNIYLNSPTVPRGTKYGGLQAITEWYDHVRNGLRKKGTREADERKSYDLLLGDGIGFKDKAVTMLEEVRR